MGGLATAVYPMTPPDMRKGSLVPTIETLPAIDQAQRHATHLQGSAAVAPPPKPACGYPDPWDRTLPAAALADPFQQAHTARVDNVLLGGFHHLAVDRRVAAQLTSSVPGIAHMQRHNRMFQQRVVAYLLAAGVRQFIDLGCGFPTLGAVHELTHEAAPAVKVAYVDIDPLTVELGRDLLADQPRALIIRGDLRDPHRILSHPQVNDLLDLGQPVAVLALNVLHHLADGDPAALTAVFRDWTVPGSYLAISHYCHKNQQAAMAALTRTTGEAGWVTVPRSRAQIHRLFHGGRMVPPGLTWTPAWHPEPHTYPDLSSQPHRAGLLAGLAHKRHNRPPT